MAIFTTDHSPDVPERRALLPVTSPLAPAALRLLPGLLPLSRHPAAVYLARLAPSSRRTMAGALDRIAGLLGQPDHLRVDWAALRYEHTTALRRLLAEQLAPTTANHHLSALRGVLKECWRLGYVDPDAYRRAIDLEPVRGSRLPKGRSLKRGELNALFETCADWEGPKAIRDTALFALLYGLGLRRQEAVDLNLDDYVAAEQTLRIRGKGNKERRGYLQDGAVDALDEWLGIRGTDPGPLFFPLNKGGKLVHRRLSAEAIRYLADRARRAARLEPFSPHDLRRTFVGDLLDAGADLSVAQQLAGHAQVQTTARYDRRGEATRQKAAGLLHVPTRRR